MKLDPRLVTLLALAAAGSAHANPSSPLDCDFNNDGKADLAFGSPGEGVDTVRSAGAVNILFGSSSFLSQYTVPDVIIHQNQTNVPGDAVENGSFGAAVACGDFDDDGWDDLVVGAPLHVPGRLMPRSGSVTVIYGGVFGFHDHELWTEDTAGVVGDAEAGDQFGSSFAVGDFDGDGVDDLAIGIPGQRVPMAGDNGVLDGPKGAVAVLRGSAGGGLTAANNVQLNQATAGIPGDPRPKDLFGASLAAGDFDGDGKDDLAIGIPQHDEVGPNPNFGEPNEPATELLSTVGGVVVVHGAAAGLNPSDSQLWHTGVSGVPGEVEAFDRFGMSVAAGDFDRDGLDDLAIGAPGEGVDTFDEAGAITVLYGTAANGLDSAGAQLWVQGEIQGGPEKGDRLGEYVVAGDFDGDGWDDLAASAPGDSVGTAVGAGAIHVILGDPAGLVAAGNQIYHQDSTNMNDVAETGDRFGTTLSRGDFNGDGRSDLAIGVPGENVGTTPAVGAMHVMYGVSYGLSSANDQVWHTGVADVEGNAEAYDRSGGVLVSANVFRMPYQAGTIVSVGQDTWSHQPWWRIDMSAIGGNDFLGEWVVVAAADGEVIALVDTYVNDPEDDGNNYVWLQHPNGEVTKYTHMSPGFGALFVLPVGTTVLAGDVLGFEDEIGQASGPHVHFGVGVPDDPAHPLLGSELVGTYVVPQFCSMTGGWMVRGGEYESAACN